MSDSFPRSERRTNVLLAVAFLVVIVVMVSFAARPSPVLGINGSALEGSVGCGSSLGFPPKPCERFGDGTWQCGHYDARSSSIVSYRVTVDGLGCWTATRSGGLGVGSRKPLSGCITLIDYL